MRKNSTATALVYVVVALVLAGFSVLPATAQSLRRVLVGGPPPDAGNWPQPEIRPGLSPAETAAAVARYADQASESGLFSGVVLVAEDGETLLARAWGLAGRASKTPNRVDTRFNIGSIGKLFTKVVIAQLAAAGKLGLDDPVRKHLPDYPSPVADRITVGQLLDHRSGLGDFFSPRYEAAPPASLRELADFLPLFVDDPLQFEPGTSQAYSNAGYVVLGLIVERVSGMKYRDDVEQRILGPAGVPPGAFAALDEPAPGRATGYTERGPEGPLPEPRPNRATLPGRPSSAGGAFVSAPDLLRFFDALAAGKLLPPEWTRWMWTGSLAPSDERPALGVAGGAPGVNAAVELFDGWTVIAMANLDPPAAQQMARAASRIVRGRPDEEDDEGDSGMVIRQRPPSAPETTEIDGTVTVPMTSAGHLAVVEATIEGKGPYRFVVDTGMGGMVRVSDEVARTLALPVVGEAMAADPSGKNPRTVRLVRIGSMAVGGARFGGVVGSVGDFVPAPSREGLDGVLGLSLFGRLTATLDYPRSELRLSRDPVAADAPHAVAFTAERGVPEIEIEVAGVPMQVDVDSGSPAFLSVPAAWGARLAFTGEPRVVGRMSTGSNETEVRAGELSGAVVVAGYREERPMVDLVDLFPVANLGSRFLRRYAVTFDLVGHRMALGR